MPPTHPVATVLVVDDQPDIAASVAHLLEAPGRRVLTAGSGPEGLGLLAREAVDLVISDLDMPEMDGIAFLTAARLRRPGLPCLLMTARARPVAEAAVRRGDVLACVHKTGDPAAFLAAVARALGGETG